MGDERRDHVAHAHEQGDVRLPEVPRTRAQSQQGELDADVRLGGTLAGPTWAGQAELRELGFELPTMGVAYREGMLRLVGASTEGYRELARAQVLSGHDVWGPPALSDGKLVIRDMGRMVCLDVRSAG